MVRFLISVIPLALTPLLGWLLAEGHLSFGGGEKDLILLLPWMVWAIMFAVAFLINARRTKSLLSAILRSLGWATGIMVLLWVMLWITVSDWLGVR